MIVRASLVALSVVGVLLVSLVIPAAAHPVALAFVVMVTLGLPRVKDRRVAIGLVVATSMASVVIGWAVSQPSYLPLS